MEFHNYAVLIEKPARKEMMGLSHAAKYGYLRRHSVATKERLLRWLTERNLSNQVKSVGEETMFNTLFFSATEAVKQALIENPAVISVAEDKPIQTELLRSIH
jgi:hypothetical protein